VTAKLKRVAESVRVVRLPGLSHKQDVSDWLTKGGTAEQLLELVAQAEEAALEPEVDPWQEPGFLTLGWWLERKLEKPENLLGNVGHEQRPHFPVRTNRPRKNPPGARDGSGHGNRIRFRPLGINAPVSGAVR
jgi:hypothetical protein